MRIFSGKILACIFLAFSLLFTGGVYATWHFAESPVSPVDANVGISIGEFDFSNISQEETIEVNKKLVNKFLEILNTPADYATLTGAMDDNYDGSRAWTASYIGNVAGSTSEDSTILFELFDGELSLEVNGKEVNVTCIVKRENIDNSQNTVDSYRVNRKTYRGCEMTLYLTTANFDYLEYNDYPPVYAMVFTKSYGSSTWVTVGETMYEGTAQVVGYAGGETTGSFDTGTWRSSVEYHGVAAGAAISTIIQAI